MGLLRPTQALPTAPVTSSSIFTANPPSISKTPVGIFSDVSSSAVRSRSLNLWSRGLRVGTVVKMAAQPPGPVQKSEDEWRTILSHEQFRILLMKGTEYPGTGEYDKFYEEGVYNCAGCGTPPYRSTTKFNSGSG